MKIGDRIYVRGYIDEIRKDTVIVRNDGGYFGTIPSEVTPSAQPEHTSNNDCNGCKFVGCYDTDFPCANCIRKNKDYYAPERRTDEM